MKVLTSKIVNGKKMFLIEDNNPQGKVFAQDGKPIKKENISNYNPYYVDVKGLNASESTKTNLTPTTKITSQEIKKIKESPTNVGNIKIKEAQEKAQRLKEAEEAYKKRKAGVSITPELLAQETQAIGDKISLQNLPYVGEYVPDILDVTGGIGSMASELGKLPLNLKRGNYGQAALSIATPLAVGTLGGLGNPSKTEFANRMLNPLAGTGDLISNFGNKYLPNAYKLNPYALKEAQEQILYRTQPKNFVAGITEEQELKNLITDNLLKGKETPWYVKEKLKKIQYAPEPFRESLNKYHGQWFDKNPERMKFYMEGRLDGEEGELLRTILPKSKAESFNLKNIPDAQKASLNYDTEFILPKDEISKAQKFSTSEFPKLLEEHKKLTTPHWLKGYKKIEVPKTTSSIDDVGRSFKSEIDWAKWNKEIPENKALMQEYNTIEQQTKANGTWMKNPDGSAFKGTPEQFVQQNSENFKKAFGNSKLVNPDGSIKTLYHGSKVENIKEFLSPKRNPKFKENSVTTKDNDYIYFSPDFKSAEWFIPKNKGRMYEVYANVRNPEITDSYRYLANPINSSQKLNINDAITNIDFNTMKSSVGPSEIAIPFSNKVKSAIGNNGMFDMTNPNIYKSIVGALATGSLGKQAMQKKEFGGKILDTRIVNGQKQYLINE